jgi:hypothetical protein
MLDKRHFTKLVLLTFLIIGFTSCIINDNIKDTSALIDPGNDPNFKIIVNTDGGYEVFNRKVVVFNISIYAFSTVEDTKLLHLANVLSQYLDNDEDGIVDNLIVHDALKANNSFLFIWKTEAEKDSFTTPNGHNGKNVGADTINLIWHTNGHTGDFDTSLKTTWNFISSLGYEATYPLVFSSQANSEISIAMDVARGGNFQNPPAIYPTGAWFTKADVTCNYACQITSYNYWVVSSMLDAHQNRLTNIQDEWTLNTPTKVQNNDVKAWAIFTNPNYNLPTRLPDGTYKH